MIKTSLTTAFVVLLTIHTYAQKHWKEITTARDLCQANPELMRNTLERFNLDYPGLENVKRAYEKGKLEAASLYLLDYYQTSAMAERLKADLPQPSDRIISSADTILNNVFTIQNVRGQVPYGDDGHRDWYYKGPNNDREWAWLSNRHSQLYFVYNAYLETGNPKYAEYIDLFLRDFIIKSMPYPAVKSYESIWRGLEVAARAKKWTIIFYGLIESEYLSEASRLLILSSLPDHAHYNRNFHAANNWLTMEISALATVAAYFPEYKHTDEWLSYAIEVMGKSMQDQVYPDGVQTELTSHYHNVSMFNFELFQEICELANKELPDYFTNTIAQMYNYIASAMRPTGYRILNNDGDKGSDREIILEGAEKFNNPHWKYIASNAKLGSKPSEGPSYFFPWAGHLISRSGFEEGAHWSFFDIGPWGRGHQHNDKLHLSITAYGRDLLVDAGRFAYTGEVADKFRGYARGSSGHNLILIDGQGQTAGPTHAKESMADSFYKITDSYDYASHTSEPFSDIKGKVQHIRSLMYVRGEFWLVVDRIISDEARQVEALWHWHPENTVVREGNISKTANDKGNLAVIPLSQQSFEVEFIKGQESPELQGWYSPEYNLYEPNISSTYRTNIDGNSTLVWLLQPSSAKELPTLEAQVLRENEKEVVVEVKSGQKQWQLTIPYMDSSRADLNIQ